MPRVCVADDRLKKILNISLKKFYEQDKLLIERKGMEQACVFRIGLYINELLKQDELFKHLNFDCEYNKNNYGAKSTPRFPKGTRPDLIIHERNLNPNISNDNNTFIMEFKGWWNKATQRDIEKLEDFTNPYMGYHYKLGALVILTKNHNQVTIRYFKNGQEVNGDDL